MRRLFTLSEKLQIFKYGIAAFLVMVPLYPKFPLFSVPGTYVAVRLEDFLIFALSAVWFFLFLPKLPNFLRKDKLSQAFILFFIAGFLSVLSAIFLTKTVVPHLALLHWIRRIEYVLPFFIAAVALRTGNIKFFAETIFITTFFVFLYGFGQKHLGFPMISTQSAEHAKGIALQYVTGARLPSTFAGHYDLAAFLVLVLPIMFAFVLAYKNLVSKAVLFFVFILPSLWLFFQAEARVSFVSLLLALTITLWVMKKRILILPVVILLLIWGIFFSGLGGRYSRTLDLYWEKIRNVLLKSVRAQVPEESMPKKIRRMQDARSKTPIVEQVSIEIRLVAEWPRAIRAFAKNPLLGTGYSSIGLATDNDYLRLLGEVGLAGTLAFLLVLIRLLTKIVFFLRKTAELDFNYAFVAGFFGGCIGFLTNASLIDVFEASKTAIYFWTLSGICTIAIKEGKNG